jgi:hypothetical protein
MKRQFNPWNIWLWIGIFTLLLIIATALEKFGLLPEGDPEGLSPPMQRIIVN